MSRNRNIPLGFMQITRNRLAWKKDENGTRKGIKNRLKIDTLALREQIFRNSGRILEASNLAKISVGEKRVENREKVGRRADFWRDVRI